MVFNGMFPDPPYRYTGPAVCRYIGPADVSRLNQVGDKVDSAAKSPLGLPRVKIGMPFSDFNCHINQYILSLIVKLF